MNRNFRGKQDIAAARMELPARSVERLKQYARQATRQKLFRGNLQEGDIMSIGWIVMVQALKGFKTGFEGAVDDGALFVYSLPGIKRACMREAFANREVVSKGKADKAAKVERVEFLETDATLPSDPAGLSGARFPRPDVAMEERVLRRAIRDAFDTLPDHLREAAALLRDGVDREDLPRELHVSRAQCNRLIDELQIHFGSRIDRKAI